MSMTAEEYTQDLVRRVKPAVDDLFGEQPDGLVEHAINLALFIAAHDVRDGRCAKLEFLGDIWRQEGVTAFAPHEWLDVPVQKENAA